MKPSVPVARRGDYIVRDIDQSTALDLVRRFHYARGGSNTGIFRHGLFRVDALDKAVGVAWWLPTTKVAAQSVSPDWRRVLSLTRLVIAPDEPQNAASMLLGESIRRIRRDGRYHTLVTYADIGEGHTGAIYRATNWEYVGERPGDPKFVDPVTGRQVARKSGRVTRTNAQMEALGYVNTGRHPKHKYVLQLKRGQRTI